MNFLTGDDAPTPSEFEAVGLSARILGALHSGRWTSRSELARGLNYGFGEEQQLMGPVVNLALKDEIEMRKFAGEWQYRLYKDRTSNARRAVDLKVWTPWRHIGRFSGELILGRVCFSFNQSMRSMGPSFRVHYHTPEDVREKNALRFARSYSLLIPRFYVGVRRWR